MTVGKGKAVLFFWPWMKLHLRVYRKPYGISEVNGAEVCQCTASGRTAVAAAALLQLSWSLGVRRVSGKANCVLRPFISIIRGLFGLRARGWQSKNVCYLENESPTSPHASSKWTSLILTVVFVNRRPTVRWWLLFCAVQRNQNLCLYWGKGEIYFVFRNEFIRRFN